MSSPRPPSPGVSDIRTLIERRARSIVPGPTQGTLALDLDPLLDPPPEVVVAPPPHAVGPGGDVTPVDLRRRRALECWAYRYCQAAAEIAGGDRPATQLARWTATDVLSDLARRMQLVASCASAGRGRSRDRIRPQVRSVHTCFVTPQIAEVSAHVRYGARSRAIAARFEDRAGRWTCTALEFA